VWNWTGQTLNLETSTQWVTLGITESKAIAFGDVNGDGKKEIITSGDAAGFGSWAQNATEKERAELKVWGYDGKALTLEESQNWIIGEGVSAWNCGTGDVDNDGVVEIITVGCMYVGTLCDPDLRVWSITTASDPSAIFQYLPVATALITAGVVVGGAAFVVTRKRRQKTLIVAND